MSQYLEEKFYKDNGWPTEKFSYCEYVFIVGKTEWGDDYDQFVIVTNALHPYIRVTRKRGSCHYPCGGDSIIASSGSFAQQTDEEREKECPKIAWGVAAVFLAHLKYDNTQEDYVLKKDLRSIFETYYKEYLSLYLYSHNGLKCSNISDKQKELDFIREHHKVVRSMWNKSFPLQNYAKLYEYAKNAQNKYEIFLQERKQMIENSCSSQEKCSKDERKVNKSTMTKMEKGSFMKLFNRGGYVLDFSTPDFDAFTMDSVGVALCQKYQLSKGKSLIAYIDEANETDSYKLLSDLLTYYETQYGHFESETNDSDVFGLSSGAYKRLYLHCKEIIGKYKKSEPNTTIAKALEESFSTVYMSQQINLMLENQDSYPAEAIGKAKELVESCCRTILKERNLIIEKDWSFQQLVSKVFELLDVMPKYVDKTCTVANSLKQIYGSLKGIVNPLAEIRNAYGTGHGKTADFVGLDSIHAKLLVGMSITLVQFLWSIHEEKLMS